MTNQKDVICWGDGTPMREFLFSDDLADACVWLMSNYNNSEIINIGTGKDMTIKELTEIIKSVVYPGANIVFNNDVNLNGTPRKVLDTTKINTLGWSPRVSFGEGVKIAYEDFLKSFIS
jgi:GDP-L-fucose synthase